MDILLNEVLNLFQDFKENTDPYFLISTRQIDNIGHKMYSNIVFTPDHNEGDLLAFGSFEIEEKKDLIKMILTYSNQRIVINTEEGEGVECYFNVLKEKNKENKFNDFFEKIRCDSNKIETHKKNFIFIFLLLFKIKEIVKTKEYSKWEKKIFSSGIYNYSIPISFIHEIDADIDFLITRGQQEIRNYLNELKIIKR